MVLSDFHCIGGNMDLMPGSILSLAMFNCKAWNAFMNCIIVLCKLQLCDHKLLHDWHNSLLVTVNTVIECPRFGRYSKEVGEVKSIKESLQLCTVCFHPNLGFNLWSCITGIEQEFPFVFPCNLNSLQQSDFPSSRERFPKFLPFLLFKTNLFVCSLAA